MSFLRQSVLPILWIAATSTMLQAAPVFSGLSFFQSSNGNNAGQFWGYPGVEVWVEQNGNWITTSGGVLNFSLLNGANTFNFYASGNGIIINEAGLNFQLGDTCRSGISIVATSGTSSFSPNSAASSFWPNSPGVCAASNGPGSGSLNWTNGVDTVQLSQFTYTEHQSSGVNRIFYRGPTPPNSPDQWPDHFGTFTLLVNGTGTAVPEPSTLGFIGFGASALVLLRRLSSK